MSTTTINKTQSYYKRVILPKKIIRTIVFVLLCALSLLPFIFIFVNATRSTDQIRTGVSFIPGEMLRTNWDNFMAKQNGMKITIWKAMFNSLIIAVPQTLLTVYFSSLTAYGIHVYNFKFKKFAWAFILGIMMIPTQISIIGFYRFMDKLHLLDTFWPVILPGIAASPVVFFMKQYLESAMPLEMIEASRVDGASELKTFNKIAMPIMLPGVATQAIFAFVASWNNLFVPSFILTSDEHKTLPMFVQMLLSEQFKTDLGVVNIATGITIIPIFVIYFILSKYIVAGVALGGVKE